MKKGNQNCPSPEAFVQAFLKAPAEGGKEELLRHVLDCPFCQVKFRMMSRVLGELHAQGKDLPEVELNSREMREIRDAARRELKALSLVSKVRGNRRPWLIPAAAGLLMIAAATLMIFQPGTRDIERSGAGQELRLLKPKGKINSAPEIFVWTPIPNCERYKFELIDSELNTIENVIVVKKTRIQLNPKDREKIIPGKTFIWTVEAYDENDKKVNEGFQSFEIK